MSTMFGGEEFPTALILELTALAGPIGESDDEPDTVFLRFERPTYTRAEVLRIAELVAKMRPDECGMSGDDLRLWWD